MSWNLIATGAGLLIVVAALIGRRLRSHHPVGAFPEVDQPPSAAKPLAEPRMQDIGMGSYELPLQESPEPGSSGRSGRQGQR
jgi:hypothetical protein